MKIMIFGDTASGKSIFADRLGKKLSLPVIHLDELMDQIGREKRINIGEEIKKLVNSNNWIIEGNAFTKGPDYRIRNADLIFIFEAHSIITFIRHITRYIKLQLGWEKRIGSQNYKLNLEYFIPYIFIKFPRRREKAAKLAESFGKNTVYFHNFSELEQYLEKT